ncbi:class I SAM-dependent methyltransferase [Actinoplanes sp. NPDC051851]|uniref:class I SAM-dependent methyltransferase n=1 Tax=Actinoplanes sp. NPDC051851 TaxID=3154753 RepID=UPI003443F91A
MRADRVGTAYSAVAGLYIDLFGTTGAVHADDLALVDRHLTGLAGPVLDLGCGPGHLTAHLRSLGADATGIDVVPEFLDHARVTHPGTPYRLGTLHPLDVAPGSVGGILAWYSLIHLPPADLDPVLSGFHRALAPGGALVTGFFDAPGGAIGPFDHKVTTAYRWPAGAFAERAARAGFTEVERVRRGASEGHRPHAAIAFAADVRR